MSVSQRNNFHRRIIRTNRVKINKTKRQKVFSVTVDRINPFPHGSNN